MTTPSTPLPFGFPRPLAVTMWDFSWLERRWPGAGYEDWGVALDELSERGYDAVRIDAYPHLVAIDAEREWELLPEWSVQDWGSPARTRVRIMPALLDFIAACGSRGIKVALSCWFRQDVDNLRMKVDSGRRHGEIWVRTLELIQKAGLLEHVYAVDLCNEWPIKPWAPFFQTLPEDEGWKSPRSLAWMTDAIRTVRDAFPQLPLSFSLWPGTDWEPGDLDFLDFLEPHIWMAQQRDFYGLVGYNYERFDAIGYDNIALNAERIYRERPAYWQEALTENIDFYAAISRAARRPLMTTECWGIVDYKDWPLLDWGWVKELCALGTEHAASTGRWAAIATSNFCGPQFRGMWRDVAWHQRLTAIIKSASRPELTEGR